MHHMLDDNINKKKHINRNITSFRKKMHLSSPKCCCKFWLYFMFLKLLAPSSIIVVAYLNVVVDFACRFWLYSMFLKLVAPSSIIIVAHFNVVAIYLNLLLILVVFHVFETFSSKFHHCCSPLECCCWFWLYFMFLKLSAPSSIIVLIDISFLDMFLNFELEISMLLKLIQIVWTCFWNFHFETLSLLWLALVFRTCFWNFEFKILISLKPILIFRSFGCFWSASTWFVFQWS